MVFGEFNHGDVHGDETEGQTKRTSFRRDPRPNAKALESALCRSSDPAMSTAPML